MSWKQQWEQILIEKLDEHDIHWEKTSFNISSNLKKLRDYEWEKVINSGQVVHLVKPKTKGAKIKLKSLTESGLPIEIGTISFYDEKVNYKKGIICQLLDKDLYYANGDKRSCLEFDQPIILIDEENIPLELINSKTLKIKQRAKKTGCFSSVVLFVLITGSVFWVVF